MMTTDELHAAPSALSQAMTILRGLSFLEARENGDVDGMNSLLLSCSPNELTAGVADASLIIVDFSQSTPESSLIEHIGKAREHLRSLISAGVMDDALVMS